ncbi:hypothetical protein HPB52_010030 [Rhipicephalus sanguineus]|uniref:Uncharacterized protein n=1 Tax=Rhipicephalus sanguineus TaxID=34632 RepID=A0A9D4SU40_RHISA|nr:hypothetical protein HPB52_010030 [Rhipicephalus sanguineus]
MAEAEFFAGCADAPGDVKGPGLVGKAGKGFMGPCVVAARWRAESAGGDDDTDAWEGAAHGADSEVEEGADEVAYYEEGKGLTRDGEWDEMECVDADDAKVVDDVDSATSAEDERAVAEASGNKAEKSEKAEKSRGPVAGPRSSSGGLFKVQGRGLPKGSCLGAVAESRIVSEAYLVWSSWVVAGPWSSGVATYSAGLAATSDSTALHTVAHPCGVKRASHATCAFAHVDDRIMLGRRGAKL